MIKLFPKPIVSYFLISLIFSGFVAPFQSYSSENSSRKFSFSGNGIKIEFYLSKNVYFTSENIDVLNFSIKNNRDDSVFLSSIEFFWYWRPVRWSIKKYLRGGSQYSIKKLSLEIPGNLETKIYPFRVYVYLVKGNSSSSEIFSVKSPEFYIVVRRSIYSCEIEQFKFPKVVERGSSSDFSFDLKNTGNKEIEEVNLSVVVTNSTLLSIKKKIHLKSEDTLTLEFNFTVPYTVATGYQKYFVTLEFHGFQVTREGDLFISPGKREIVELNIELAKENFKKAYLTYQTSRNDGLIDNQLEALYTALKIEEENMMKMYNQSNFGDAGEKAKEVNNLSKQLILLIYKKYLSEAERKLNEARKLFNAAVSAGVHRNTLFKAEKLINQSMEEIRGGYSSFNQTINEIKKHSFKSLNLSQEAELEIKDAFERTRKIQAQTLVLIFSIISLIIFLVLVVIELYLA